MAFGKRTPPPADKPAAIQQARAPVAMTSSLFLERATRLKEHLERIMTEALEIATAIKQGRSIDTQGFTLELDVESFPIDIAGFHHHFNFERGGQLIHGVYTYSRADGVLDRTAQLHLLDLTSAIAALNGLCADAHREGALTMVLQSSHVRGNLDRVIVLSSFIAGMLDNMITLEYARQTGVTYPGTNQLYDRLDKWGHGAHRAMLDPASFESIAPKFDWPLLLVETEEEDHQGQLVVNQVYLPADIAGQMSQMLFKQVSAQELLNAA